MRGGDQFFEMCHLFFGKRPIGRRREHGQDVPATRAHRKVAFPLCDFLRLERPLMVRRD